MRSWLNSSMARPSTILYLPFSVVTGKPNMTSLGMPYSPLDGTPMVTHLPLVPRAQSRMWSMAALAAEAADETPRASMMAAPRLPTVGGKNVKDLINDQVWNADVFLPTVGKRGAAIIEARGLSSAASAANAAIDHMRDWALGSNGKWVTMGIPSDGWYEIPKDTMFGFAVTTAGGEYKVVEGLEVDAFSRERINVTLKELQEEQEGVKHLL